MDPADAKLAEPPVTRGDDTVTPRPLPAPIAGDVAASHSGLESASTWLGLVCGLIEGATLGAVLVPLRRPDSEDVHWQAIAQWPAEDGDLTRLKSVAEWAHSKGRTVVRPHPKAHDDATDLHDIAHPLEADAEVTAVVAVAVADCSEPRLPQVVRQLQSATSYLPVILAATQGPRKRMPRGGALEAALWLVGSCLEHDRFRGAATAVATDLADQTGCERVAVGFIDGQQIKVQALSHSADFGERMNLIRRISAAMDEAVDQRAPIVVPALALGPVMGTSAHEVLIKEEGSAAVCSVLLTWNDDIIGAITLERSEPFEPHEVATLEDTATLLGPILELKRRDDRWLPQKAWDALRFHTRKLVGPRHLGLKVAVIGVALVLLYLTFATGMFRVTAPATLEGAVMRVAVAPLDGFIVEAPVRAGDLVSAGAVLCVLDDRDLRLEQRNLQSQRDQVESEYLEAMARGERVEMGLLANRMEQADAQLDLLAEQLGRLRIVAPIDGIVVSGDLSQSIGAPVQQGDVLFEVAPLDTYRLMLRVDERDVAYVTERQRGAVVLAALSQETHEFTIEKVTPVSISEEGTTYFLVEAGLDDAAAMLRPGMEGVGKIDIENRRRIWIVTRRLTDWLRLWVWSWRGPGG